MHQSTFGTGDGGHGIDTGDEAEEDVEEVHRAVHDSSNTHHHRHHHQAADLTRWQSDAEDVEDIEDIEHLSGDRVGDGGGGGRDSFQYYNVDAGHQDASDSFRESTFGIPKERMGSVATDGTHSPGADSVQTVGTADDDDDEYDRQRDGEPQQTHRRHDDTNHHGEHRHRPDHYEHNATARHPNDYRDSDRSEGSCDDHSVDANHVNAWGHPDDDELSSDDGEF